MVALLSAKSRILPMSSIRRANSVRLLARSRAGEAFASTGLSERWPSLVVQPARAYGTRCVGRFTAPRGVQVPRLP